MKSQSIAYLLNESEYIYIYIKLDLEGEVHWIWDLWINGLQECKGNGFFEVGQADSSFQLGLENLDFLDGRLPKCSSTKKFMGGGGGRSLTSPLPKGDGKVKVLISIF